MTLESLQELVATAVRAEGARIVEESRRAGRVDATGVPSDRAAFTVREVAKLLQVAPETVREWFYADRLKGMQTGNRILVWRWSLLELMGLQPVSEKKAR